MTEQLANTEEGCEECGRTDGYHTGDCYHADCDEDDWVVHGCGPLDWEPEDE